MQSTCPPCAACATFSLSPNQSAVFFFGGQGVQLSENDVYGLRVHDMTAYLFGFGHGPRELEMVQKNSFGPNGLRNGSELYWFGSALVRTCTV